MSDLGNKKVMAKNIKHYMSINNVTQTDICRTLNIAAPTFSDWVNAKTYPRIDKIEMIANYFGIQKSDLIEDEKILPDGSFEYNPTHKIPILGCISAGLPLYAEQNIEGYTYTELNGGAEYFALRVNGDSMTAARIYPNDILIVRRQETVENGEIAVVLVDGENATVKRFRQENNMVILEPHSNNPEHQTQIYNLKNTSIKIIGKVVKVEYHLE